MMQSVAAVVPILLLGLFISFPAYSQGGPLTSQVTQLIRHFQDELPSIRETIQKMDEAPETKKFLSRTKEDYQDDLNGHLDDALSILLPDSYRKTRKALQEIDDSLDQLRAEQSELEAESALKALRPSDKSGIVGRVVNWVTGDDIEDEIRDLQAKTVEQESKRDELLEDFRELVRAEFGLELD